MTKESKPVKFRRFGFFFYASIFVNAVLATGLYVMHNVLSLDESQMPVIAMYLIFSFVFWDEVNLRLVRVIKDIYLMTDRNRTGYKVDVDYNGRQLIVTTVLILIGSMICNTQLDLLWFGAVNLGLIMTEMSIFIKQKPKIEEPIDVKIADLRVEIISIFYKLSLEKMRSTEKIYRISVYLDLGELDYFLNHTDLIEKMYDYLRAKTDQLKNESDLYNLNCFIFSLTCRAYLYASDCGQADLVSSLKEKAVTTAVIENRYEVMRYLD